MIDQNLLNYIREQSQQGFTVAQIKSALLSAGWQAAVIEEALQTYFRNPAAPSAEALTPQPSSAPLDAFSDQKVKSAKRFQFNKMLLIIIGLSVLLVAAIIYLLVNLDFKKPVVPAPVIPPAPVISPATPSSDELMPSSNLRPGPMIPITN